MRTDKIRIMAWGGIGDILMATPALRELRAQNQRAKMIVYYYSRHQRDVLINNPHVDALVSLKSVRVAGLAAVWLKQRILERSTGRPYREFDWGKLQPSLIYNVHASKIIGEMLGVQVADFRPEIFLGDAEEQFAEKNLVGINTPIVAIHTTGACTRDKDWYHERWEDLVARNPGFKFIQLGAPGEKAVRGTTSFIGVDLRNAFALIKRCRAFVGVESGLSHVAAAFEIPAVILFGPTSERVTGNPGQIHLRSPVGCAPCVDILRGTECPFNRKCMRGISVGEVEEKLRSLLGSPTKSSEVALSEASV